MKRILCILFVLAALPLLAQHPYTNPIEVDVFAAGADTLGSSAEVDTLEWQVFYNRTNPPAVWNQFSTYLTSADKVAEREIVLSLANESAWTWGKYLRFRILSASGDTLTGSTIDISRRLGALTVFWRPDTLTSPSDTTLHNVIVAGQ